MTVDWTHSPFVTITLPLIVTLALGFLALIFNARGQNRAFDALSKRVDDQGTALAKRLDDFRQDFNTWMAEITKRLDRIEEKLEGHERRITTLEERSSPWARR